MRPRHAHYTRESARSGLDSGLRPPEPGRCREMTGGEPTAKSLRSLQRRGAPSGRCIFPSWTSPVRIRSAAPHQRVSGHPATLSTSTVTIDGRLPPELPQGFAGPTANPGRRCSRDVSRRPPGGAHCFALLLSGAGLDSGRKLNGEGGSPTLAVARHAHTPTV
jgi:hypothetical protein